MILLARGLVRLLAFVVLVILAVAGLALAIFCIGTGTSGPSPGGLAALLHLAAVRDSVGGWLGQWEAAGTVALVAGLCGLAAMALGLFLLAGVLVPRRERLVTLSIEPAGRLAARRRPLAQVAQTLVEQVRGVTEAKVRVRPRRTSGGRMSVRASRPRPADAGDVRTAIEHELDDLTGPFKLTARVDVSRRGSRVQ